MDFSHADTARTYSDRAVDDSWLQWCRALVGPVGKRIVDIGCGGGIYAQGFLQAGAQSVTGVDASEQYIKEARLAVPQADFLVAACDAVGLPDGLADVVFERALVHHLTARQQKANAEEMFRLLADSGMAVIQDRSQQDVLATDDRFWIRAELMQLFPRLVEFEASRRPAVEDYTAILQAAGFSTVAVSSYAEVRKVYADREQLLTELRARKGKSILFQLSDAELAQYVDRIAALAPATDIIECDSWTVWKACKDP